MAVSAHSTQLKPGYKLTEVGVIPEDWEATSWGKLATLEYGKSLRGYENTHGPYPVYGTNGFIGTHTKMLCRHPGVIVGRKGAYRGIHFSKEPFYVIDTAYYLEPKEDIDLRWAYYELLTHDINRLDSGSAIPSTSRETFYNLAVIVPPLPEQRAIAAALSDVDALIASLDRLIAKKRAIKRAAMQQLLTGKTRLSGFGGEWEMRMLGDIAQLRKERVDPRQAGVHEFCIELEHIEPGTGSLLGYTSTEESSSLKSVFQKDDVLFGKLRAYLRKYWLAYRDGVCSTEIWVLSAKRSALIPQFLFQIVKTDRFIEVSSSSYGTHMPRSDWNVVKNYEVNLPPVEEQTAIVEILSDMDAEIDALEQRREKTRALKQGMMQELLTGRIRLR